MAFSGGRFSWSHDAPKLLASKGKQVRLGSEESAFRRASRGRPRRWPKDADELKAGVKEGGEAEKLPPVVLFILPPDLWRKNWGDTIFGR